MSRPESLTDRVIELEMLVMRLERDLEMMNSVMLAQQSEIEVLKRAIGSLEARVLQEPDEPPTGSPSDEID